MKTLDLETNHREPTKDEIKEAMKKIKRNKLTFEQRKERLAKCIMEDALTPEILRFEK